MLMQELIQILFSCNLIGCQFLNTELFCLDPATYMPVQQIIMTLIRWLKIR